MSTAEQLRQEPVQLRVRPLQPTITLPIKMAISKLAVDLLYWLGYPVASAGVTIQIAPFELLAGFVGK